MEEIRPLLNNLLKSKIERALMETLELLEIAEERYVRDFVEIYGVLYPEAYEKNKKELENIRQTILETRKKLVNIKNEMKIY